MCPPVCQDLKRSILCPCYLGVEQSPSIRSFRQSNTTLSSKTDYYRTQAKHLNTKISKHSPTKLLEYSVNLINVQKTCCHVHIMILGVGPT